MSILNNTSLPKPVGLAEPINTNEPGRGWINNPPPAPAASREPGLINSIPSKPPDHPA
jgi:hypothetical protein